MSISSKPTFDFDDYDVLVGIDFGTTFSGCSYVYTVDEEKNVHDIRSWPHSANGVYPKAPTTSLYNPDGTLITWGRNAARKLTGYELRKKQVIYQSRFKLRLDSSVEMEALPEGFTTIKLITDYLKEFHKYVLKEIECANPLRSDPDRIRYCLTVPAIWDDKAKTLMREAAVRAGIVKEDDHPLRLILTSEPEAAAIYCEKQVANYDLKPGNRFMICDAGGGTVDLIVFEIAEDADGVRSLREITKGSGNTCGSTFIDQNMEKLLRKKLSHFGTPTNKAIRSMLDDFIEEIKHHFGENHGADEYENITIPGHPFASPNVTLPDFDAEFGIQDDKIRFSYDELCEKVFDPVVKQTITLIDEQLKSAGQNQIDALFLVGGFGCSAYLYKSISKAFKDQIGTLSQVPGGEKAIAKGAVYFGLAPTLVSARVLRRTYGMNARIKFNPTLDSHKDLVKVKDKNFRQNGFSVYVTKGDTIETGQHVLKTYTIAYPENTDADIYVYNGDGAPPRSIKDPAIERVFRFPIRMPDFPDLKNGEHVTLSMKMYFGETEIRIEVAIRDRIFTCTSKYDSDYENMMLKHDLPKITPQPTPHHISTFNDPDPASDSETETGSEKPKKSNRLGAAFKKIIRSK